MNKIARNLISAAVLAAATVATSAAWAGRPCTEAAPTPDVAKKALTLAHRTQTALDATGAEVALLARVGQDLSKYGLRYSHFGVVWRDHPQGRWRVVHELNQCSTATSGIFVEGLGNFFLDDMFAYEAQILIPSAETQRRIAVQLASDKPATLHGSAYNMLAYAFSTSYQNSNQWALELYAAAAAREMEIANRAQAQAWLKAAGYQPITIRVDAVTRLGARMFRANIAFDDHPFDRRMAGQIDTVTVDSVFRFVEQRERDARKIFVTLQDNHSAPAAPARRESF